MVNELVDDYCRLRTALSFYKHNAYYKYCILHRVIVKDNTVGCKGCKDEDRIICNYAKKGLE